MPLQKTLEIRLVTCRLGHARERGKTMTGQDSAEAQHTICVSILTLVPAVICEGLARAGLQPEQIAELKFLVSDMWENDVDVVRNRADDAVHILDRFHVMKKLNEAANQVRRDETRRRQADGYEPVLNTTCRCRCPLKRPENLSDRQTVTLKQMLTYNVSCPCVPVSNAMLATGQGHTAGGRRTI